ncbi:2674_t:CDS:2 [Gigaspora rosea]|nr:2674_t:CDS:2 [Gigaspora rosea]
MGIGVALILALAFWIFGICKDRTANNFIIFNCVVILYDFVFELAFLINNSPDNKTERIEFQKWFKDHLRFAAIMTILAEQQ